MAKILFAQSILPYLSIVPNLSIVLNLPIVCYKSENILKVIFVDEKGYVFLSYDAKNINSHRFKKLHT